jgi:hypothetical protein
MNKPSERALSIAEELLDYVHPGMSRAAALQEVAQMVDAVNADLVEAVNELLAEAERSGPGPQGDLLHRLRQLLVDYRPWRAEEEGGHELFASNTSTGSQAHAIAGQMP